MRSHSEGSSAPYVISFTCPAGKQRRSSRSILQSWSSAAGIPAGRMPRANSRTTWTGVSFHVMDTNTGTLGCQRHFCPCCVQESALPQLRTLEGTPSKPRVTIPQSGRSGQVFPPGHLCFVAPGGKGRKKRCHRGGHERAASPVSGRAGWRILNGELETLPPPGGIRFVRRIDSLY